MNHKSQNQTEEEKTTKTDFETILQVVIITVLAMLIFYNGIKIYGASENSAGLIGNSIIGTVSASEITPTGVPAVYGEELGISYDDISASNSQTTESTIQILSSYEDDELSEAQLDRYVKIGSSISCEYCCGAKSLVFSNGQRACGCAHSYAMRGLEKYLLINHPDMTDVEILNELGKWKVLFFPGVHEQKAQVLKANGIDYTNQTLGYIYLASNLYRGIETQASSSGSSQMVGGC